MTSRVEKKKAALHQKEKLSEEIELRKIEQKKQQEIRDELIRKIRELDRRVIKKTNHFDPDTQPNQGYINSMTINQLKEELRKKEQREKEWEEQKRLEIKQGKV